MTNSANGHVYFLLTENTWQNSELEAVRFGGHLVTINDAAEQDWVFSTLGSVPGAWTQASGSVCVRWTPRGIISGRAASRSAIVELGFRRAKQQFRRPWRRELRPNGEDEQWAGRPHSRAWNDIASPTTCFPLDFWAWWKSCHQSFFCRPHHQLRHGGPHSPPARHLTHGRPQKPRQRGLVGIEQRSYGEAEQDWVFSPSILWALPRKASALGFVKVGFEGQLPVGERRATHLYKLGSRRTQQRLRRRKSTCRW